jgi:transcriptional regulator with XRE-family HTH domain
MIHHKLKLLRKQKGFSQLHVADALHITQNTYSNLETGKTKIDIELLLRFAEFYKKQPSELLDFHDIVFDTNDKVTRLVSLLEEQLKNKDVQIEQL